jgi:hypothetical protein
MHPQLDAIRAEFRSAQTRLHALAASTAADRWPQRAESDRWSVAECVGHLNLTGAAFVPVLRQAVTAARLLTEPAPRRYRRDPFGWLLWRLLDPAVRLRFPTTTRFIPTATEPPEVMLAEFDRLQTIQIDCLEESDGRPLGRVRVESPFSPGRAYNLYSCFTILPRHQHRHLQQAERVWGPAVGG